MEHYLPVIVVAILYLMRIREFLVKRETVKGPVKEKTSFILLFAGGTLVVVCSFVEYFAMNRSPSYTFMALGTLITLGAFAYRNWAIRTLGKFWSVHVEIRDNHELITSGPFKSVRHPVYTGALLEVIGAVFILKASFSALLILLVVLPSIYFRIHIEEKELIEKFGDNYREYRKRTGSLLPKLKTTE